MTSTHDSKFLDDPKFQSLLVACLESVQRGESIDREALARDHPQYAREIERFLEDRQLLEEVASKLGDVEPPDIAISAYERTAATTNEEDFVVGDTLRYVGEYEILDEIARGGMGIVFKARQQNLHRVVALKMILAGRLADDADIQRFYREARASGRLRHPHIVPVHEIGEHEGRHYFTMDFIDGPSLAEEIREESLAPRRAAEIVRIVAGAVQFAHDQGTVHRDLKPANVLLAPDNSPHITDFGLAKMLQSVDEPSRAELTASGQILGTPSYMSPEQASGKQELVGPAADIYSLGAILYACLTGRAPFVADSQVDTLLQVMKKEPVSPRKLNPSIPKDLETICLKCLTKEPHKRYGTAQELADDLNRFLEGQPVMARPVGRIRKAARWCRRNKAVAALLGLLFLSMASGTYVSAHYAVVAIRNAKSEAEQRAQAVAARHEAEAQRRQAERARREAEQQRDVATAAKATAERALVQEAVARQEAESARQAEAKARKAAEDSLAEAQQSRREAEKQRKYAQWQTYVAQLQPMRQAWLDGEYGHLDRLCAESTPGPDEPDFRGWEWYFLHDQARSVFERIGEDESFSGFLSFDKQRGRALVEQSKHWELWDVNANKRIRDYRLAHYRPETVHLSPDGNYVAWGMWSCHVRILALDTGRLIHDIEAHPEDNNANVFIGDVAWSPDGKQLATATTAGSIKIWDVETGSLAKQLAGNDSPDRVGCLAWGSSGDLASLHRFGWIHVWDIEDGTTKWSRNFQNVYFGRMRWNPSGTKLGVGIRGSIAVFSAEGELQGKLPPHGDVFAWMSDDEMVYGGTDQEVRIVDTTTFIDSEPLRIHSGAIVTLEKIDEDWILSGSLDCPMRRFRRKSNGSVLQMTEIGIGPDKTIGGPGHKLAWGPRRQANRHAGHG